MSLFTALISSEPPVCGGVSIFVTTKVGVDKLWVTKVIFTCDSANSWNKLTTSK